MTTHSTVAPHELPQRLEQRARVARSLDAARTHLRDAAKAADLTGDTELYRCVQTAMAAADDARTAVVASAAILEAERQIAMRS